jgi:hypothetical protein
MLEYLRGKASDRKLRLFACACLRSRSLSGPDGTLVTIGELQADGLATHADVRKAQAQALRARQGTSQAVWVAVSDDPSSTVLSAFTHDFCLWRDRSGNDRLLLRDLVGNPFRRPTVDPAWRAWGGGTVPKLAQAIYDQRAFDRLPVLADALEDAGCADPELLGHLRGPGPHARGCWALDLLLGKE